MDRDYQKEPDMQPEESEIDLLELVGKIWKSKNLVLKWVAGGVVAGLIVAFSIPKEYVTEVKLAPESKERASGLGGLSGLASMAGINLGSGGSSDAVSPMLYPEIVESTPFVTGLFDVEVKKKKDSAPVTVAQYVEDDLRSPWWSAILSFPGKAIGGVMSLFKDSPEEGNGELNIFSLSPDQTRIVEALNHRISTNVDTKSSLISVSVTMQDPLVSAMLADTVVARLQEYVVDYRTNKARHDLEYAQKLNDEAAVQYHEMQQKYASYVDRNQGISTRSGQTEATRLQNEATLAYNLYNTTAQQLQLAKAKVQEITPVYAVVKPATVPIRASKPSKVMIIVGFAFLAFVISAAWILYGKELMTSIKQAAADDDKKKADE